MIETATCAGRVCLESVSTSGKLSHVGTVPGTVRANWGPSMDASGNVWLLVDGSAAKAGQQFYLRLTSGNKLQTYAFAVPGCGGSLLTGGGQPSRQRGRLGLDRVHLELHLHRQHSHRLHRRPGPLQAVAHQSSARSVRQKSS